MSSNSQNGDVSLKRIDKLFLQFAAFYGPIWRSQFKQDEFLIFMKQQWHEALAHFDNRVVELAVNSCRDNKGLPPTLPQFIEICKGIRNRDDFIKAEPSTTKSGITAIAKINLTEIKKLLTN